MTRRGPRPLLLHLALSALGGMPFSPGSMPWSSGWPGSSGFLTGWRGAGGGDASHGVTPAELVAGIAAYRRHPWARDLVDPHAVWAEGESRLLDYGGPADGGAGSGPVLFVPSLVNRAHVLDLFEGRSMLRFLAARQRVLLLDWGWPGEAERGFTLTDYVAGRLERAIGAVGEPVVLVGYCMGGLLALAAAQRRPERVRALALLATPWDFHAADPAAARRLAGLLPALEPMMAPVGRMPIDAIQALFALMDPGRIAAKYAGFAKLDQESARARQFVAIEDWLNDGVPLAGAVTRECLGGWYGENTPARGMWRVAGEAVVPGRLRLPSFVAVPGRDRIVPPESALPLAGQLPGAVLHRPASGHVGMVAGGGAERALWRPLQEWIATL
jgi:polyhydroxyalkanoate synthase subunit PhaC